MNLISSIKKTWNFQPSSESLNVLDTDSLSHETILPGNNKFERYQDLSNLTDLRKSIPYNPMIRYLTSNSFKKQLSFV